MAKLRLTLRTLIPGRVLGREPIISTGGKYIIRDCDRNLGRVRVEYFGLSIKAGNKLWGH